MKKKSLRVQIETSSRLPGSTELFPFPKIPGPIWATITSNTVSRGIKTCHHCLEKLSKTPSCTGMGLFFFIRVIRTESGIRTDRTITFQNKWRHFLDRWAKIGRFNFKVVNIGMLSNKLHARNLYLIYFSIWMKHL